MSASLIWLVIKALITILPAVIEAVRDGRIRASSQEEVLNALTTSLDKKFADARAARDAPLDDDILSDTNNRAARKDR